MSRRVKPFNNKASPSFLQIGGLILIILGILAILDLNLLTGQIGYFLLPASGILIVFSGWKSNKFSLFAVGMILTGFGAGVLFSHLYFQNDLQTQIGLLALGIGLGWVFLAALARRKFNTRAWWALQPGTVFLGLASFLLLSALRIYDFVFYMLVWIGLGLLVWGMLNKLFGLILAGCITISGGTGIFFAWGTKPYTNGLTQTGEMLIWFALGWFLIVFLARINLSIFIWWPLIPGSILAVVGWGLYLSGGAASGMQIVGNSGAIALIVIGIYLLLLRKGMQK